MGPFRELALSALPGVFVVIGWLVFLVLAFPQQAKAQDQFPPVPELIFGVNQYNVGPPELEAKYWPLKDEEIEYLKTLGVNTIRFPLYPAEIGVSPSLFGLFEPGQVWEAETAVAGLDWRSLDAVLDQLASHDITPYISPAAEDGREWQTKSWMRLHIPEEVEKTLWLTRIVAEHVQAKYGGNVIYGWFEDWYWNTGGHERSTLFPAAWRAALGRLYEQDLALLNTNWASNYASFEDIVPPVLYQPGVGIPSEAFASRRTYDLRLSIDLMQREALTEMAHQLKLASPNAVWAGGCICGELSGWLDTRSVRPVKTNASIRTHALTSDFLTADTYAPPDQYAFYYRTLAKLAHLVGKRYLVAEVSAVQPEAFKAIAEAGGPIAGVLAWVGKEDKFGLFKMDGTLRKENAEAFGQLYQHLANPANRAQAYVPGRVQVYLPEETLEYSITRTNFMEAYFHICDALPARDLEPVLTDELATLPPATPLFVLEQVLPRRAIEQLNKLGSRLICPHRYFVDETGARIPRATPPGDFYTSLMAAEGGPELLEAFARVYERSNNLADVDRGGKAEVEGKLAQQNVVISGRPNDPANLVDGSLFEGITFSDEPQDEAVILTLPRERELSAAFVELFAGSEAEQIPGSRVPASVRLSVAGDSGDWHDVEAEMTQAGPRLRFKFAPTLANRLRFDFGPNEGEGMRLVEVGVLEKSLEATSPPRSGHRT